MNTRKTRSHRRLTSALCALALLLSLVPAAQAAGTPAVSNNLDNNACFGTWADPVKSHLVKNGDGLTRVEYITSKETVIIEDYSSSSPAVPSPLNCPGGADFSPGRITTSSSSARTIPMRVTAWRSSG